MNSLKTLLAFTFLFILFNACRNTKNPEVSISAKFDNAIYHLARSYITTLPELDLDKFSENEKKIIELGKSLYYEKKLSANNTVSCATCHDISKYGVDNMALPIGDLQQIGTRNTITVFNTFLYGEQNWDNKFKTVEEQAIGPIFAKWAMAMPDTIELLNRLDEDKYYRQAFDEAFPSSKSSITINNLKKAIGAFERILLTPSRFDEYLKGNLSVLTPKEKLGVYSFVMNCKSCHSSALVGGGFAIKYPIFGNHFDYSNIQNSDPGNLMLQKIMKICLFSKFRS
ncbi:MAG: cytochrome-c peroxidase [Saprospiraceae bacterium]|nr:cytochrome-c peroxidase [Saprospiraceae bacterium]